MRTYKCLFYSYQVFGLLCAGAARRCCTMLQLTDGWLMLKTNYQLWMSGSKREEKEERCLVKVKPMICRRMVICYLIFFPSLYSKWASLETQGQLVGTKWYFWAVQYFRVGEPLGTSSYIVLLLNQLQKHSSTFAQKYCVAWKYRVSWLANWVSEDAKWAESKYCCMIIVQLSLKKLITCMFFIEIRRCSSFAYASKQRQRSLQVSTVCHSIKVIKSWTKKNKSKITFTNLHSHLW